MKTNKNKNRIKTDNTDNKTGTTQGQGEMTNLKRIFPALGVRTKTEQETLYTPGTSMPVSNDLNNSDHTGRDARYANISPLLI